MYATKNDLSESGIFVAESLCWKLATGGAWAELARRYGLGVNAGERHELRIFMSFLLGSVVSQLRFLEAVILRVLEPPSQLNG